MLPHESGDDADDETGTSPISLPLFPLNAVVFPAQVVPLHIFEERYRDLMTMLMAEHDTTRRVFGTVAIREGYEVGDHGAQSLYRVGTRLQITEATRHRDGTWDLRAVGRDRIRLRSVHSDQPWPRGTVDLLDEDRAIVVPDVTANAARELFADYVVQLELLRGPVDPPSLPRDAEWLSWTLAGWLPLPMAERQSLLETPDSASRLELATSLLRAELRAMRAFPSLPATQMARTHFSPN